MGLSRTANFRKKEKLKKLAKRALPRIAKTALGGAAAGGIGSYIITRKLGLDHKNALPSAYTGALGGAALALPFAAASLIPTGQGRAYIGHKALKRRRVRIR
jgi:hypothetical protein